MNMSFNGMNVNVNLVQVQFKNRRGEGFSEKAYTYIADVPLAVGDIVKISTKFGDSEGRVSRIDVPITEIQCRVGELKHITEPPAIGNLLAAGAV